MSNQKCNKCGVDLIIEAVPGAAKFPRRLVCPTHGYPKERNTLIESAADWREGMAEATHGASEAYYAAGDRN